MTMMDEPIFNYVVTRGDSLKLFLRISGSDGEPLDWTGYSAEIVVRLKGGGTIVLTSPDRITLVDPGSLAEATSPNLLATLTDAETAQLTTGNVVHAYQVRITEPGGDKWTALKGTIDARYSAAEGG